MRIKKGKIVRKKPFPEIKKANKESFKFARMYGVLKPRRKVKG